MSSLFGIGGGGNVGASGSFYPYSIDQSLRFNDGDSAQLTRTPSSASNRKTWTLSCWVKRSNLTGASCVIFSTANSSPGYTIVRFNADNKLYFYNNTGNSQLFSDGIFRDTSAWYHIVAVQDSTNATAADRMILYVNGEKIPQTYNATYGTLSLNFEGSVNNTVEHRFGAYNSAQYFDGYIAEAHLIDGTALDPTSFGETINGVWVPKAYSGSYGTNGFYLSFADSSAIGDDLSGNGNDWTANNLAASDVVPDSPTNNFATNNGAMRANITHSEGNLKMVGVGGNFDNMAGTFLFDVEDTDGWYWEGYVNSGGAEVRFGISKPQNIYFNQSDPTFNFAHSSDGIAYKGSGSISTGGTDSSYGDSFTTGDVIGIAVKAGALYFYKNGSIQNSGTAAATGLTGQYVPAVSINSTLSLSTNYGQDSTFAGAVTAGGNTDANGYGDFKYSVPSGYKALCSANLPEPAIGANSDKQADDYFNTVLYTGDGTSSNAITGVGFQPDWVWIKQRTDALSNQLFDVIRGVTKGLRSDLTAAEYTNTTTLTSFDSDGFTVGSADAVNGSSDSLVSWNWKAGGTAVSNTDGSITSQVSAAPDAGMSIVSWVGNSTAGATVGHGLGKKPTMIIVKNRDSGVQDWPVQHGSIGATGQMVLSSTAANNTNIVYWNNTEPTSSVFSLGTANNTNQSGNSHVAYVFTDIDGYSATGSYVGNGSADGTFVYTGFRPAWVMIKSSNLTYGWVIVDTKRNTFNVVNSNLFPHASSAEDSSTGYFNIDAVSNGFKIRTSNAVSNQSGGSYIYLAFAEAPFKYANAR